MNQEGVRLSVAIMHAASYAERRVMVQDQLRELQRHRADLAGLDVVKDTGWHSVWNTARRAWERGLIRGGTHHLVLQDDAVLCRDFVPAFRAALAVIYGEPVAPFANRRILHDAHAKGCAWARIPDGAWGLAFCMPTELVLEFLGWQRWAVRPTLDCDDSRLRWYLLEMGRPAWACVPSLVQHGHPDAAGKETHPSRLGHGLRTRVAPYTVRRGVSALSLDWTRGLLDTPTGTANSRLANAGADYLPPERRRHASVHER